MSKRLYVGNLPYSVSEDDLQGLFTEAGQVESVKLIVDRETGRSKGFAFVEMAADEGAERAITELNGRKIDGRPITVNEARPQQQREGRMRGGTKRQDYGQR